jgi:hypothetical protein
MNHPPKRFFQPIPPDVERIGKVVLDAAFRVHTALGPGLLESAYRTAMKHVIETIGFLINFNMPHLKDGIKRIVV